MNIVKKDSFRSQGTRVNQSDDMYRVVVDMKKQEYRRFEDWAARQNTKESPVTDTQHTQPAITELAERFCRERDLSKIEEVSVGFFAEYVQQQQAIRPQAST